MMAVLISVYRWTLGYLVFAIGGVLLLFFTFLPPERLRYRVATLFSRTILWALGARLRVEGSLPTDQACILMANHSCFADPFILAAIMNRKFTGVMAEEMMKYPLWGSILRRFQVIPIRRRDRNSALASMQLAEERLQAGYHVAILPEGTRTLDGKVHPLKKGGFHMALNTGAPIVVIGIEGGFRFKSKASWLLRPGPITVRIGKAIPPGDYRQMTMEAVMEKVYKRLTVLSGETGSEEGGRRS